MSKLLLLAQLSAVATGTVEIWPGQNRDFHHRQYGTVQVTADFDPVVLRAGAGLMLWHSHSAKIPGWPFNLESSKVLERSHWLSADYAVGPCHAGAWIGRRGVEWIAEESVWRKTRGYYDGASPLLRCGPFEARGPLLRWHPLTLPWPDYHLTARVQHGPVYVDGFLQAGGTFNGPAWDVGLAWYIGGGVAIGARIGALPYPGPNLNHGPPLERAAFQITAVP